MQRQRQTSSFTSFYRPCSFWLSFCSYHFGTLFWSIDNFRSWTKSWNKVTIQTNVKYVFNHSMEAIIDQQKSTAITSTSVSHVWLQSLVHVMDLEDARFVTTDFAKRIFLHCTWASLELKYRMIGALTVFLSLLKFRIYHISSLPKISSLPINTVWPGKNQIYIININTDCLLIALQHTYFIDEMI